MSYGLKNALPTFVCAMHKTFGDLMRDLVEVYVDDIVVKIKSLASLLDNLALVIDRLPSMCMKLNLDKCVFGVTSGKLLGFLVSYQAIEANQSDAASRPHQGCAEAHGMLGRAKPVYL
jgi:hypothetical protein